MGRHEKRQYAAGIFPHMMQVTKINLTISMTLNRYSRA